MIRLTVFLMFAVAASVAFSSVYRVKSFTYCEPCVGEDCDAEPKGCIYGVVKSHCNTKICAPGPGDRCGGRWGTCGDGMDCTCGVCTGCSLKTLECNYDDRASLCI